MRDFLKTILYRLPRPMRTLVVYTREWWWKRVMRLWEKHHYPHLPISPHLRRPVQNVLIYHLSGLSFAGTEKCLQVIANALAEEYNVFFMYGDRTAESARKATMNPRITFIPFSYDTASPSVPHRITTMKPHFKEVLHDTQIDLIVTASPGYAHYPWNIVDDIPIVLVNIFGAPTLQKNVHTCICISDTVRLHAEAWSGEIPARNVTMYAPLAKLPPDEVRMHGMKLRHEFGIAESDFVFGRIGRDDNAIFDPIGIRAWQKIASEYPHAHYLIMSPPPVLVELVRSEAIPRVHFLPKSAAEHDVWAFHGALDAMAHFRRDGETSGVAIAESLIVGNPILTHRSSMWNAHLEYLDSSCARVAAIDDALGYSDHMKTFIELHKNSPDEWLKMREAARKIGMGKFSPVVYSDNIRNIVANI